MGSKYDRHMDIVNLLVTGQRIKCVNLAFEFNVSTKTIKQDIAELSLYYPIDTYAGCGGGIELRKGYIINGYIMKRKYLDLICEGMNLLKNIKYDPDISIIIKYVSKTAGDI